ncbi:MAG: T9SS type A sorting domain-containing protein [Chitinophagales bacterium]|nr:T9SS type A sorting domain-containing protein [Chitinophagales bacterium]
MKKLLTIIFVVTAAFAVNTAQAQCICTPIDTFTEPGLYPEPEDLGCIPQNVDTSIVINFKNYNTTSVSGINITVDSIRIDSIINLPCGFEWKTNTDDRKFNNSESGCITVQGITSDPVGQYKLDIYVSAWINGLATPIQYTAEGLGLRYDVRVNASAGASCPDIDSTSNGLTASCRKTEWSCVNGIEEVANNVSKISNFPNPFNSNTEIIFAANEAKTYTFRVFNILGATMHTETVDVVPGQNRISFDAKNLESGVYFFSLSNGQSSVNSKMVVNK